MLVDKIGNVPDLGVQRDPAVRLIVVLAEITQRDDGLLLFHGRRHCDCRVYENEDENDRSSSFKWRAGVKRKEDMKTRI